MRITIRHAEHADAPALRDLYAMPNAQAGTLQLPYPTLGLWQQRLESDSVVGVAEVDDLLVCQLAGLCQGVSQAVCHDAGGLRRQPSLLQLSKNGHAPTREAGYAESRSHERRQAMKTEQMAPRTLAYIRVTGPYGTGYEPVCDQLFQWSAEQGLAEGEWIFIYHDNPEITAPQQCRTDICVTVPASTRGSGNVEIQPLAGGRYGQSRFTVTDPAQYPALWQQHIGEVVAAGFEFDDRPCFELYHSVDPVTKIADVSFCSSLKG